MHLCMKASYGFTFTWLVDSKGCRRWCLVCDMQSTLFGGRSA